MDELQRWATSQPSWAVTSFHVREALLGKSESAGWLYRRLLPLLERHAVRSLGATVGRYVEADDLVDEAWRVLLPRLRDIEPRDGRITPVLLSFLTQTITRLANEQIRKHARRRLQAATPRSDSQASECGEPIDHVPGRESTVTAKLVRDETVRRVRECIESLSPRDQEIIDLRAVAGFSNKDAASKLGEDENTVAQRYHRARARLIAMLPGSVFEEIDRE